MYIFVAHFIFVYIYIFYFFYVVERTLWPLSMWVARTSKNAILSLPYANKSFMYCLVQQQIRQGLWAMSWCRLCLRWVPPHSTSIPATQKAALSRFVPPLCLTWQGGLVKTSFYTTRAQCMRSPRKRSAYNTK